MSNEKMVFPDGKEAHILSDYLHCEEILVREGDQVKTGDILAIADNTGFSTGPHTHEQNRRIRTWNGQSGVALQFTTLDRNDANHSFDGLDYATGFHAEDYGTLRTVLIEFVRRLQALIAKS
jgi:murein DD-endopeptidase MepM/ murein hydrolase activator NlpD